jgi:hypothetical protein
MRTGLATALGMLLLAAALPACRFVPDIVPPFDATGAYQGNWNGTIDGQPGRACVLKLDIQHDARGLLPGSSLMEATLELNLSCPSVYRLLEDTGLPAIQVIALRGYVSATGRVYLGTVQTTLRNQIAIGIDAQGHDDDEDGGMDRLDGEMNLVVRSAGRDDVIVEAVMDAELLAP